MWLDDRLKFPGGAIWHCVSAGRRFLAVRCVVAESPGCGRSVRLFYCDHLVVCANHLIAVPCPQPRLRCRSSPQLPRGSASSRQRARYPDAVCNCGHRRRLVAEQITQHVNADASRAVLYVIGPVPSPVVNTLLLTRGMRAISSTAASGRTCCLRPVFVVGSVTSSARRLTLSHDMLRTSLMRRAVSAATRNAATAAGGSSLCVSNALPRSRRRERVVAWFLFRLVAVGQSERASRKRTRSHRS